MNRPKAIRPASTGESTQLMAMAPTWPQLTESTEMPTAAKPTIAPTMEWVVETGQPRTLAIISQAPAANRADIIPYTSNSGESASSSGSIMPLRMVAVTSPPAR